jgi:hypothetical protein
MEDRSVSQDRHVTTRRDFVKSAGVAAVGALGFPAAAFTYTRGAEAAATRVRLPGSSSDTPLATNGFLSSLLPLEDRTALREINVQLTELAIQQCGAGGGAANVIQFGTLHCLALADLAAHDVFPEDLLALSRNFDVVFPWSLTYGNDRTPFNYRFVKLPLIVAFPRTVDDVVFWVNFVRDHALSVSVRSGNNSYEGLSSENDVIIDVTFLTLAQQGNAGGQIHVDAQARVAHVASGVRFGALYAELDKHGLTFAGGQCAPVCVGGFVGTGGVGFSTRAFGYGADQLVEVQYVLADGSVVVASASNQFADLYRATKGAGAGGLGVMTRLTLKLVPSVPILFYNTVFDLKDGAAVLAAWQNLAGSPLGFSSVVAAPASSSGQSPLIINGELRVEGGTSVAAARNALINTLQTQWLNLLPPPLDQTEIDITEMTTLEAATTVAAEVPQPFFNQWKLKSKFVFRSLTAAEFQPIIDFLLSHSPSDNPAAGAGFINLLLGGGTTDQIDPNSAVIPARAGTVSWCQAGALWNEQSLEPQSLAFTQALWGVLDPILQSQTAQYGVPDLDLGSQLATPPGLGYVDAFWKSPSHDFVPFLLGVKQKYDPTDVFRGAQTVPILFGGR